MQFYLAADRVNIRIGVAFMFGRIQNIDNRVLDNISRIHKPALNRIMITASRAGNAGLIWWAICLPFLINPSWRATAANFIFGLA